MRVLPSLYFEIRSAAAPHELASLLAENTESGPIFQLPFFLPRWRYKLFVGAVSKSDFRIRRVGRGRNSFRPSIFGTFEPLPDLTLVRVSIKYGLEYLAVVGGFLLLYAGIVSSTVKLDSAAFGPLSQTCSVLLPVALLLITDAVCWLVFPMEAKAAKEELQQVLSRAKPLGGPS